MPRNPELRASDADRDRVAEALREHHAVGRLDPDEFQDRLEATYRARTLGELDVITTDLPAQDLYAGLPVAANEHAQRARPKVPGGGHALAYGAWATWAGVSLVCTVIWVLTMVGGPHWVYPWPLWVVGPWGVVILVGQLSGAGHHDRHRGSGPDERLDRHERHRERRLAREQARRELRRRR